MVVDEALGEFADPAESAAGLVGELPNLVVVRSFSKGHAHGGPPRRARRSARRSCLERLAPSGGLSAPAVAAVLWAVSDRGVEVAGRRRDAAATLHAQLADGLRGTPYGAAPAPVPFAWIAAEEGENGPALSARLAARQVFVAPGTLWGDRGHVRAQLRGPAGVERLVSALAA